MSTYRTESGELLIAAPERWDEACFSAPAVRAFVGAGMAVGVLCREDQKPFWQTVRGIALVSYAAGARAKEIAAKLADRWQGCVAWEAGVAADAAERAKIPRRVGPDEKPLKKRLTHPVDISAKPGPPEHRVRRYLALAEAMGCDVSRAEWFAPADLGITPEPGTVLLCPDSDFGRLHEWPLERWIETGTALLESGRTVTIGRIAGGANLGEKLGGALPEETPYFDIPSPAEVLPLLAVHHIVLAADGSLPHLAAHAGATCVTLFGPNDPQWKRPLGRQHAVVSRYAECAPCFLTKCPFGLRCQQELDTAQVWDALRQVMGLA